MINYSTEYIKRYLEDIYERLLANKSMPMKDHYLINS